MHCNVHEWCLIFIRISTILKMTIDYDIEIAPGQVFVLFLPTTPGNWHLKSSCALCTHIPQDFCCCEDHRPWIVFSSSNNSSSPFFDVNRMRLVSIIFNTKNSLLVWSLSVIILSLTWSSRRAISRRIITPELECSPSPAESEPPSHLHTIVSSYPQQLTRHGRGHGRGLSTPHVGIGYIYCYTFGDVQESDSDNDDEFKCGSPIQSLAGIICINFHFPTYCAHLAGTEMIGLLNGGVL